MAEKRMFTKKITDDDNFTSLPSSAQALYFHLNQGADDDGFNSQVQLAMWKAHASTDDLQVLLAKRYVIRFEKSGVIVIKHWRMHNTLRKDRYTPTNFQEELQMLGIKSNGSYTLDMTQAERLPNGCQMVAIDKSSEEKNSIDKSSVVEVSEEDDTDNGTSTSRLIKMGGTLGRGVVFLTEEQEESLLDRLGLEAFDRYVEKLADFIIDKGANVANHYMTILKWYEEDTRV